MRERERERKRVSEKIREATGDEVAIRHAHVCTPSDDLSVRRI